jgi:NADH-quinone oxidoreductase subunit H
MLFLLKFAIINIILYVLDLSLLKALPIVLPILLAVAFFTVFERKVLAAMQRRRGPNVVGIYGLLQAIADAVKLLSKETLVPASSNLYIFLISPIFTFLISMLCWSLIPFDFNIVISDINLGILFLFAFSSLGVYGIIMAGWSSNSKYSFLGALRSSAHLLVMKFPWVYY